MRLEAAIRITVLLRRVPFSSVAVMAALGVLASTPARLTAERPDRGRVQGVVRLTAPSTTIIPSGVYGSRRVTQPSAPRSEVTNVVIFLNDVAKPADLAQTRATMLQKDEVFQPR